MAEEKKKSFIRTTQKVNKIGGRDVKITTKRRISITKPVEKKKEEEKPSVEKKIVSPKKPANEKRLVKPDLEKKTEEQSSKKTAPKPNKSFSDRKKSKIGVADAIALTIDENDFTEIEKAIDPEHKESSSRTIKSMHKHKFHKPVSKSVELVKISGDLTIAEIARLLSLKSAVVVKKAFMIGVNASVNQTIDQDAAALLIEELGHKAEIVKEETTLDKLNKLKQDSENQSQRSPVVTVMGHVDHGKTSLLDYIRNAKVVDQEAGGITQHIGAYNINTQRGNITFLDTPGHASFSAMRSRGAKCTDIVILIVAADDGVKPQTLEALQHAKAAEVPIIVAVNKIDKPEADFEKVRTELSSHDLVPEDWGGDTMFVPISAKSGKGVEDLLDNISLQAEMLELKASNSGNANGVVIESRLDKGKGAISTLLVQNGELKIGDLVLVGNNFGKVRSLLDHTGKYLKSAGPSVPVEVLGIAGVSTSGDEFVVVKNERVAREIAKEKEEELKKLRLKRKKVNTIEDFMSSASKEEVKELNIVVKTDVHGSCEALIDSLVKLSNDKVSIRVVGSGVGAITESDIILASASNSMVLGFNVRADNKAKQIASKEGIEITYHSVIYDVVDNVKSAVSGLLGPIREEVIQGVAKVKEVFRSSTFGVVAGCQVISGTIYRGLDVRVLRDNKVIFKGDIKSLRRFKDDVKEVKSGVECGIGIKDYTDIKEEDEIEVFEIKETKRN